MPHLHCRSFQQIFKSIPDSLALSIANLLEIIYVIAMQVLYLVHSTFQLTCSFNQQSTKELILRKYSSLHHESNFDQNQVSKQSILALCHMKHEGENKYKTPIHATVVYRTLFCMCGNMV